MTAAAPALALAPVRWLWRRLPGWEDWLTLALSFLAFVSVAWSIQHARWADIMPNLVLLGLGGLLAGMLLARLPLPAAVALPMGLVLCLLATFLQSLFLVYGDGVAGKVDVLYVRFQTFFDIAFGGGISNDVLPFAVLVAGLAWAGAFLFAYCLFRWSLAWPGLLLGGLTLFVNFVVLNRGVLAAFLLYAITGLLLLARANLARYQALWRREGVPYPSLLGLSVLHLTFWAILLVLMVAWMVPTNYGRPLGALWGVVAGPFQELAQDWSRLVGPLRGGQLLSSADLGEFLPLRGRFPLPLRGELALVRTLQRMDSGTIILRAAIYSDYTSGGWRADDSLELDWPFATPASPQAVQQQVRRTMRIDPAIVQVQMEAASPISSLLLVPGRPLPVGVVSDFGVKARLPEEAVLRVDLGSSPPAGNQELQQARQALEAALNQLGGPSPTDDALRRALLDRGWVLVRAERGPGTRVRRVEMLGLNYLLDNATLVPQERLQAGQSYWTAGILPVATADTLLGAPTNYPQWLRDTYLALPGDLPERVRRLAQQLTATAPTPYEKVRAVEALLQTYPIDQSQPGPPAGRDPVDHFLFEARRGSPEYHASAMVVLLRAAGVPARLVVGIALTANDFVPDLGAYRVTARNAYVWPEIYFPGVGWLPFSPVPRGQLPFNFPYQQSFQSPIWPSVPVEPGLDPFGLEGLFPPEELPVPQEPLPTTQLGGGRDWSWLWALLGALGGLALLLGAGRLAWELPLGQLPFPLRLWEKTVRLANLAALGPRPGETPREFVRRLYRYVHVRDLPLMAEVYGRARYGGPPPSDEETEKLRQMWPEVRQALARQVLRRPWRRTQE
jgi:hypothetical protein